MFFESPVLFGEMIIPSELATSYNWMVRQFMLLCGIMMVIIGVAGIFLPLVPTTGPLLAASFLLAKGSPRLQRLLCDHGVTGRYLRYMNGSLSMPWRARLHVVGYLWCSLLFGSLLLSFTGNLSFTIAVVYAASGAVGTLLILNFRPKRSHALQAAVSDASVSPDLKTIVEATDLESKVLCDLAAIGNMVSSSANNDFSQKETMDLVEA